MKNGGLIRKMQTAAGGPLQLTPEEQKYLEWSKMTPEQRRNIRWNRTKAQLQGAPSIPKIWEAFQICNHLDFLFCDKHLDTFPWGFRVTPEELVSMLINTRITKEI